MWFDHPLSGFQNINPNIEYYLKNSSDFIATRDGLILTNVVLESPGTVTIQVGHLSWLFYQGPGKKEEFKSSFCLGQRKQACKKLDVPFVHMPA